MIGGLSSSLATAVRTAGEARQRMDVASREIATGKRVSSAKDDGAAWAQAAALRSQQAGLDGRDFIVASLDTASSIQAAQLSVARESFARLRDIFISAAGYAPGTPARSTLKEEFDREIETLTQAVAPSTTITSAWGSWPQGWGVQTTASDPLLSGEVLFLVGGMGFGPSGTHWTGFIAPTFSGSLAAVDVLNGTQADMREGVRYADYWLNSHLPAHEREAADDANWLDRVKHRTSQDRDRLDAAIGALTDTDLGKASTALRQNETRQQLALQTVRQALDAYGAYAGGLLRNAQQTQRAVA